MATSFYEIQTAINGHPWIRYWCEVCFAARRIPSATDMTEIVRGPVTGPPDAVCVVCKTRVQR